MDKVGVFTPEQAREMWQWYLSQKQLAPQLQKNFPQRRPIDEVSPHRAFVLNSDSYEAIPPYACMQITGTEQYLGRTVITVAKPTTLDGEYLFNSQFTIEASAAGWAYRFGVVVMLGSDSYADITANAQYTPIVDSWEIEEGSGPFVVFGRHDANDKALIGRFGNSGGGGETMWFSITEMLCPDGYEVTENTLIVTPVWYTGGCSRTPPGGNGDGTWDVYDVCNYLLDQVAADLPGTMGRATYYYPYDPYDTADCVPRWILSDLCAAPECA